MDTARVILRFTLLWAAVLSAGCSSPRKAPAGPVDNWGPSAGFAVVEGTVRRAADHQPVAGAEVMLTRCTDPIGGYMGGDTTDAHGRYRIAGSLPPVGLFPPGSTDSLQVRCYAFVNRMAAPLDSLDLRFRVKREAVRPVTLDLRIASQPGETRFVVKIASGHVDATPSLHLER